MNTALLANPGVLAPLRGLWRWLVPATKDRKSTKPRLNQIGCKSTQASLTNTCSFQQVAWQGLPKPPLNKPLRIVRILESDQTPANVGRMVISGRMDDVCAELDRLAALH